MAETVKIFVDGQAMQVPAGITVAAAILGHSHDALAFQNNSMDGSARAPYCLMGVCYECMMEINGQENVQSCLVAVEEGMQIKRQMTSKAFTYTVQKDFATPRNMVEVMNHD